MRSGEHKRVAIDDATKSVHHHPAEGPGVEARASTGGKPAPLRAVVMGLALVVITGLAAWQFFGRGRVDTPTPEQVQAEERQREMVKGRTITAETPAAEGAPSRAAQPAPVGGE